MGYVIVGHFLIWLIHVIWYVLLLFSKLSFLILLIPISFLSGCGLFIKASSVILFTGLLLMLFLPFKAPFNLHEHRSHVTHLYKALEVQLFREMCPPIIDDHYLKIFQASITENYAPESIFLGCIYENEEDTNHDQVVKCFLREDALNKLNTNGDEKQKKEPQRNDYNCSLELKAAEELKSLDNTDIHNEKNGEELENKSVYLNNDDNKYENGDEYTDKRVEDESDVCYSDKIIGLEEQKSSQDVELSRSNIEHSQVEETNMINESRSLVEEKALERNRICNVISEISHDNTIDNQRKFDANESIPECVEQVEKVIAVINADSLSDDTENYGKPRNSFEEVEDEDLIAVINVLQSDSDTL